MLTDCSIDMRVVERDFNTSLLHLYYQWEQDHPEVELLCGGELTHTTAKFANDGILGLNFLQAKTPLAL